MRHTYRRGWIQAGAAALLLLTLSACNRSASTALTPLPSAPPPTATIILASEIAPEETLPPIFASEEPAATDTPVPVEASATEAEVTATTETPTATKAIIGTEAACGNALPSRLHVGSFAYVNPDPPLPNNLRSEAGQANELIGTIDAGQAMSILDGPKCVDGSLWWKVKPLNGNVEGWTAEGDDQTYWLVPCSSESQCGG